MKIMKKFNKVIAIMMMMSITFAMPAMAGNKSNNHGKNDKAVVVNNHKSESHFDKVDKALSHNDAHKTHAYRPDVKATTIKVSRLLQAFSNRIRDRSTSASSESSCHYLPT